MTRFSEVQDLIKTTVKDFTYPGNEDDSDLTPFANYSVISDKGRSKDEIEKTLRDTGFVITVYQPVKGGVKNSTTGANLVDVMIPVGLQLNTEINDTVNILEAIEQVIASLEAYVDDESGFDFADEIFELTVADEGLTCYILWVIKTVAF